MGAERNHAAAPYYSVPQSSRTHQHRPLHLVMSRLWFLFGFLRSTQLIVSNSSSTYIDEKTLSSAGFVS